MSISIPFTKMQGLGNDFVLLPGLNLADMQLELPKHQAVLQKLAAYLCDRHFGIGGDGLIIPAAPSDPSKYDIRFIYLNSDGSWAEMCGNGIRCFARYVQDQGLVSTPTFRVETLAGLIQPTVNPDQSVTVNMGAPILKPDSIPFQPESRPSDVPVLNHALNVLDATVPVTPVSMGNPHCIVFQDDLSKPLEPAVFGPALELHPAFPAKTNVEFVKVLSPNHVQVTVWERGCGFTLACGTGACATVVAAQLHGKANKEGPVQVDLPGGPLQIEWNGQPDGPVFMTGPAAYVFEGTVAIPESIVASVQAHPLAGSV